MMIEPSLIVVGSLTFALHIYLKWRQSALSLGAWIKDKETGHYLGLSTLLCILALLLQPEVGEVLGMSPRTYAAVMCYGGGHAIAQVLGIKEAAAKRKAAEDRA